MKKLGDLLTEDKTKTLKEYDEDPLEAWVADNVPIDNIIEEVNDTLGRYLHPGALPDHLDDGDEEGLGDALDRAYGIALQHISDGLKQY